MPRNLPSAARAAAALAAAGLLTIAAAPAAAAADRATADRATADRATADRATAAVGYVRLAHLSPDTPAVDVYLNSQGAPGTEKKFPGVAYGALSEYLRLTTGDYAVAMRTAGAPESERPVLTTQVSVAAGRAYTVAGVGRYADLGLRVLQDDIRLPAGGAAKVRIVQASVRAPVLTVDVRSGPTLASRVAFATTTGYRQVDPGRWNLRIRPAHGGATSEVPVTLAAGSVYSLLILDGPAGRLTAELHTDAGRQGPVPAGGVETGAGGARGADGSRFDRSRWLPPALALALLAAALLVVGTRYRPRRR